MSSNQANVTNVTLGQHATRERLKKQAIQVVRRAIDAVPSTGAVQTFAKDDWKLQDALLTLSALGHSPDNVVLFVARDRLDKSTYLKCLSIAISAELLGFINAAMGRDQGIK